MLLFNIIFSSMIYLGFIIILIFFVLLPSIFNSIEILRLLKKKVGKD